MNYHYLSPIRLNDDAATLYPSKYTVANWNEFFRRMHLKMLENVDHLIQVLMC